MQPPDGRARRSGADLGAVAPEVAPQIAPAVAPDATAARRKCDGNV